MYPTLKQMKEKLNAATQIDTEAAMARLDVTIVLYLNGEDMARYLSTANAASVKIDAVLKMKYIIREILTSMTFS